MYISQMTAPSKESIRDNEKGSVKILLLSHGAQPHKRMQEQSKLKWKFLSIVNDYETEVNWACGRSVK